VFFRIRKRASLHTYSCYSRGVDIPEWAVSLFSTHPKGRDKRIRAQIHRLGAPPTTIQGLNLFRSPSATALRSYGSGSGQIGWRNAGFVAASYAEAIRKQRWLGKSVEEHNPRSLPRGLPGAYHQEPGVADAVKIWS